MKKILIAGLATGTPNAFSQEVVLHLKKPNTTEVISVKTSGEKALDWLEKYATIRGLQLELEVPSKTANPSIDGELNLFAMEIKTFCMKPKSRGLTGKQSR